MNSQYQNQAARQANAETKSTDAPNPASSPENKIAKSILTDDDLIVSLQNRRENRRARQVVEWEIARRAETFDNVLRGAA